MTGPHCELHDQNIIDFEKRISCLEVAVFRGDSQDKSIKDRIYATEYGLKTMEKSIEGIATHMRDQAADKRKLMLVVIGGSLTFFFSSLLMFVTKLLG